MAWIESHQSLKDHPKRMALSTSLDWDAITPPCYRADDLVIAKLHRFWWWCMDYAIDGDLRRFNDSQIAGAMGVAIEHAKQLVEALVQARWLEREPYFRVRNWWQYAGRFLQVKYKNNPQAWKGIRDLYDENQPDLAGFPQPRSEHPLKPPKDHITNQPTLTNLSPPCSPPGVWKPDGCQARLSALFGRKESTRWSDKELKAYKRLCPIPDDDLLTIESYYKAQIARQKDYRRRDLCTLLNNFQGELDRARNFKGNNTPAPNAEF